MTANQLIFYTNQKKIKDKRRKLCPEPVEGIKVK